MVYAFSLACWACVDEAVSGRGVDVAAGVVDASVLESCCESVGFVVMNEASDRECTLTSESEVVEA